MAKFKATYLGNHITTGYTFAEKLVDEGWDVTITATEKTGSYNDKGSCSIEISATKDIQVPAVPKTTGLLQEEDETQF